MKCPKCHSWQFETGTPCPSCGFQGDASLIEQLGHLDFLLGEIGGWVAVPIKQRSDLHEQYTRQRREIERKLGILPPVLNAAEAQAAQLKLKQVRYVLKSIPAYFEPRGVQIPAELAEVLGAEAEQLKQGLLDAPEVAPIPNEQLTLACYRYLKQTVDEWLSQGRLPDTPALQEALASIEKWLIDLEVRLGLRVAAPPRPKPAPTAPKKPVPTVPSGAPQAPVTTPAPLPRQPWTWDRLWDTLLAERTLHAMLFLGVGLLVAAAVSLIVWNWTAFPPLAQVGFLALFTATFYGLGWYVRVQLKLRGSGIALSAFASLLVPLEIYAIYLSGGFPAERWPEVWWGASLMCLLAYIATTLLIQAEFFGYLVGLAGGSLLCATLQLLGVETALWQMGLGAYILALGLLAELFFRPGRERWKVLASPLWLLSLIAGAVLLVWNFALGLTAWRDDLNFRTALALTWWQGGVLYAFAASRARSRTFTLAAATIFPVAALITQAAVFPRLEVGATWYALGLALLAPGYLAFSRWNQEPINREIARWIGVLLIVVPAIWAFFNVNVASIVHPLLGVTVVLASRWWQRPQLLYAASLLFLLGSAAFVAARGLPLGQIGLAWGLLAIALITAGNLAGSGKKAGETSFPRPLYFSGWFAALLCLLPPLVFFDGGLLAYALGNWTALNGWLALLQHEGKLVFTPRRFISTVPFQWLAATALPLWAWQSWRNAHPAWLPLALVSLLLAWALLGWSRWLRRTAAPYAVPWYRVGEVCAALTFFLTIGESQQWAAALLSGLAAYYFSAAVLEAQSLLLWPASLLFPLGLCLALDLAWLRPEAQPIVLGLVALAYATGAQALERWRRWPRSFLLPVYRSLYVIGPFSLALSLFDTLRFALSRWEIPDAPLIWSAGTALVLAVVFALRAWWLRNRFDGYLATWLGALACGLAASGYSHGTGRSTVAAALAAWGYVLLERAISRPYKAWKPNRVLLLLFRWPLITSAWLISAGVLGLAVVRNLILLRGTTPAWWAVVALWLIVALYVFLAWRYHRWRAAQVFVYIAAGLAFIPWTLMIWLIWPRYGIPEYGEGWAVLAVLEWLIGALLAARAGWGGNIRLQQRAYAWQAVAHTAMPGALLFSMGKPKCAAFALGLGVAFYLACTWYDRRLDAKRADERFLYVVALILPLWASAITGTYFPFAGVRHYAVLLLAFSLPALGIGRWLATRQPNYRKPFYWLAYLILLPGTLLAVTDAWLLVGAFLLCTLVGGLSAWLFRRPLWVYPSMLTLTLAWSITLWQWQVSGSQGGWGMVALAACFLLAGRAIHQIAAMRQNDGLRQYATPLVVGGLALGTLSLWPSGADSLGVLFAYAGVAMLYAFCAFWLRKAVFLAPAVFLAGIAYLALLDLWRPPDYGLALWPWIVATLAAAIGLDRAYAGGQRFPWNEPMRWPEVLGEYIWKWWAFPFYTAAFTAAALSSRLTESHALAALNWLLAGAVYGLAIYLFRRRFWVLACATTLQLAALSALLARSSEGNITQLALYFAPLTWATLFIGLWLEDRLAEGAPFGAALLTGWSRPLYLLVLVDICLMQGAATFSPHALSPWVTLSNALVAALLAFWWLLGGLAYLALGTGAFAAVQGLSWNQADAFVWPWAFSLLVLAYGLCGYMLRYARTASTQPPRAWAQVWEKPLVHSGWVLSAWSLALAVALSLNLGPIFTRALLGLSLLDGETTRQVQMGIGVLAVLGIFYLTAAIVERYRQLAYGAVALLLAAWSLEWLLVWGQREVQWYVLPAGLYLLAISYFEWTRGGEDGKSLARWLDRAALLLLLGSVFWQSLGDLGGRYALLMGVECLLAVWWGSARRLRRFLYIGVAGMTLNVFGQLIDPLLSANRWIVFAFVGSILLVLAILIERRRETVLKLSADVRKQLEGWE
ncbi:MAG: hypothetical protein ACOYYS_26385 [Chloroflexota bacterium]